MRQFYATYTGKGKDSLLHRNLRMCSEEGLFATPFIILSMPGNLFIAAMVTQVLGLNEGTYGLLVSLPAWFNALQVAYIPFLARFFSSRALTLSTGFINLLFWLSLIIALPYIAESSESMTWLLFLLFCCISVSQSTSGVAWTSWIREWVPDRIRGKYFGQRNAIIGFATVVFIFLGGQALDYWGTTVLGFQILLAVTGVMRFISLYAMTHIYTPWSEPEKMIHEGWSGRIQHIWKNKPFIDYLIFQSTLAFLLNTTGPFVPIFMATHLGVEVGRQATIMLMGNITSALAMPLWGRLCDTYGCKPVITFSAIAWMTANYLWVFVSPELSWLLYFMWLWGGMAAGGVLLGGFNLLLKVIPLESKTAGVSINLMATSVTAAMAPILVGLLLSGMESRGHSTLTVYRSIFFLQPTLAMLSLLLLARVNEPASSSLYSLVGAFRSLRQTLIHNGFPIAANLVLFRQRKKSVVKPEAETDSAPEKEKPSRE